MQVDLIAPPAQHAVGRRLGLAGFALLEQVNQGAAVPATIKPGDASPAELAAQPATEPPDHETQPDANELLYSDEQRQVIGSQADQRQQDRAFLQDGQQQDQTNFRAALRDAQQSGQQTAPRTPATPPPPTDAPDPVVTTKNTETPDEKAPPSNKQPQRTANESSPGKPNAAPPPPPARPIEPLPQQQIAAAQPSKPKPAPPVTDLQRSAPNRTSQAAAAAAPPRKPSTRPAPAPERDAKAGAARESAPRSPQTVAPTNNAAPRDGHSGGNGEQRFGPSISITKSDAPTATAQLQDGIDPADRAQNLERIVRVVQAEAASGNSRVVMQLSPPELGNLRLQLNLRRDQLDLRVQTDNELARGLLLGESDQLRSGLQQAGLELVHLDVQPSPSQRQTGQSRVAPVASRSNDRNRADDPNGKQDPVAEPRLNVLA